MFLQPRLMHLHSVTPQKKRRLRLHRRRFAMGFEQINQCRALRF